MDSGDPKGDKSVGIIFLVDKKGIVHVLLTLDEYDVARLGS
jgi:hypothetical protein